MDLAKKQAATQSQKLMVFVLTMALYGLATLFTELIPKFQVGIVEFSVEYFLFIPLTLAMLFDPLSAALGAAFSIGMVVAAALAVAAILVIKIKARSGESVEQKA